MYLCCGHGYFEAKYEEGPMGVHLKWAFKAVDLKEIVKGVGPGFGTIIGIVGLTVEIMTAPSSWRPSALLVLFTGLFLVAGVATGRQFMASGRRRERLNIALAQIEDVSRALEGDTKYILVPAKEQDVTWTVQLRADCYSEEDALPEDLLQE